MTLSLSPQACRVSHQVRKLFRGNLQAWLCFGLDDCHLPPVSARVSSHHLVSPVMAQGSDTPAPGGKWCAPEKVRFCDVFSPASLSLWVPECLKELCFWLAPTLVLLSALVTPYFILSELVPASTARFCRGERGGRTYVLPLGSQVSRGNQTVLRSTEARSPF